MDDQDQYERVGLDDSMEDERDLDQIMADRRAAEVELDARNDHTGTGGILDRKLPQMLYDQGIYLLESMHILSYVLSSFVVLCIFMFQVVLHLLTHNALILPLPLLIWPSKEVIHVPWHGDSILRECTSLR